MTDKKDKNDNFLLLPNNLVWDVEGKNNTLIKKYGDKIVHVLPYLDVSTNRLDKTTFSLADIITTCGLKLTKGKGKTIDQFKVLLNLLKKDRIIKTDLDFNTLKVKDLIKCEFEKPILKNEDDENTEFFTIKYNNYLKIMDEYNSLDKITLLKIYFYINSRIFRRYIYEYLNEETGEIEKFSHNIQVHGGRAECFFDSYFNICGDLDLSEDSFHTYIQELNKMNLIFFDNIGLVKKDKSTHPASNVYCIDEYELPEGLKQSKLYYEKEGYKVLGKKTTTDMKKINGTKGKIQQEQNRGKDTTELENNLIKLQEKKSKKHNGFQKKNEMPEQVPESIRITQELQEENVENNSDENFIPNSLEELLDIDEDFVNSDSEHDDILQQHEEEMKNYREVIGY